MVKLSFIKPNQTLRIIEPKVKFVPMRGLVSQGTISQMIGNAIAGQRMFLC